MPIPLAAIQAGANAVQGVSSLVRGLKQKKQAKELESKNKRPAYTIPQELLANKKQSDLLSQQGLPSAQKLEAEKGIERSATAATTAATDRRAGIGVIGAVQQGSNDATGKLTAQDAAARIGNIKNAMAAGNTLAAARDKAWNWNEKAKFEENAAAIRALKGASNANLNTALEKGISVGADVLSGKFKGLFNKKQTVDSTPLGDDDLSSMESTYSQIPQDASTIEGTVKSPYDLAMISAIKAIQSKRPL